MVHPEKVATPAVAGKGFVPQARTAPLAPVPALMARVTELVFPVTVLPYESCIATTGCGVQGEPLLQWSGLVVNASLFGVPTTSVKVPKFVELVMPVMFEFAPPVESVIFPDTSGI